MRHNVEDGGGFVAVEGGEADDDPHKRGFFIRF